MSEQPKRRRRQQLPLEEMQEDSFVAEQSVEQPIKQHIEYAYTSKDREIESRTSAKKPVRDRKKKASYNRKTIMMVAIFLIVVFVAILLFGIIGLSSPSKKYELAQAMLAKGKYDEAAKQFEDLGSYEDATTLAMYCKACAFCESGDYDTGMKALAALGDYRDCTMRLTYYTARQYEDKSGADYWEGMLEAKLLYGMVPIFLDSSERITALDVRIENAKKAQYNKAVEDGENGYYEIARQAFKRLGYFYSDSEKRYTYYGIRKSESELSSKSDQDTVISVSEQYTNMGNYLDCTERAASLIAVANGIVSTKYAEISSMISEGRCSEADSVLSNFGEYGNEQVEAYYYALAEKYLAENKWDEASFAFMHAGKYGNAVEQASESIYLKAEYLLAEKRYDEASAAFSMIRGYRDSQERITEPYYIQAQELLSEKRYVEAYHTYSLANGYKDSVLKAASIVDENWELILKAANVGDSVFFGVYEQDGDVSNGKEDIEWLVLEKKSNRLLVISKYALDCMAYHTKRTGKSWEGSSLREWLNNDFINSAFSNQEQSMIPTVTITVNNDVSYGDRGNSTQDKVFLLSTDEVTQYFTSDSSMQCQATAYAKERGAYTSSWSFCYWWLRSIVPHWSQDLAARVNDNGAIDITGGDIRNGFNAIRPAIWIELAP